MSKFIRHQKKILMLSRWFLSSGQRLVLSVFAVFCLPFIFLLFQTQSQTKGFTETNVVRQNNSVARLASKVVEEHLTGLTDYLESFAIRRMLLNQITNRNKVGVQVQLEDLLQLRMGLEKVFVTDPAGKVIYGAPQETGLVGQDYSRRDWYLGASRTRRLYISEIYQIDFGSDHYAIDIAIPLKTSQGLVLGYLVCVNPLRAMIEEMSEVQSYRAATVHLLDHHGRLASDHKQGKLLDPDMSQDPLIMRIRDRKQGFLKAKDPISQDLSYLSFYTISRFDWTVIVSQKASSAMAPARLFQRVLLVSGAVSLTVMVLLGAIWLFILRGYHKMLFKQQNQLETSQEQLGELKDYLRNIINCVPDPIFVKDRQHRFVLLNDACCRIIGRQRDELLGKSDYDFFPPEEADVFWKKDEWVFTTGRENINEEAITDIDGFTRTIVTKKALYRDKNDELYIVGVIRDVTQDRVMERQMVEKTRELDKSKEQNEQLELLATTDPLTSLLNRRGLSQILNREVQWSKREHHELTAMMIDLDDFKQVNDKYGHTTGDTVLAETSKTIKKLLRATDYIGRVGGDEFIVLMPKTKSTEAEKVALKLKQAISNLVFRHDNGDELPIRITASFGIASVAHRVRSVEDMLRVTQYALRESKMLGKNRVSLN